MKPIYGTTLAGTEQILDLWLNNSKEKAWYELVLHISVNKPESKNSSVVMAKDTIERYIKENF